MKIKKNEDEQYEDNVGMILRQGLEKDTLFEAETRNNSVK